MSAGASVARFGMKRGATPRTKAFVLRSFGNGSVRVLLVDYPLIAAACALSDKRVSLKWFLLCCVHFEVMDNRARLSSNSVKYKK
jgi:hypothetical protein